MSSEKDNGLTRRAVLRGAAVAGAMTLARPGVGLAGVREPVFSRWLGTISGLSAVIAAPRRFALVGVEWDGPTTVGIELRTRVTEEAAWSPWAVASVLGHGPDRVDATRSGFFGEPIWSGAAGEVQLRVVGVARGVRLHFVSSPTRGGLAAHVAGAFPLAQPVLDAGPGQPAIIARSAWAQGHAPPSNGPFYGAVKLAFVHHSETPNGYGAGEVPSILMSIYTYHRYVRGFFDIGYNFAVDAFGRIWEARAGGIDLPVMGAHAGGYNTESTGMVVLGSFMDVVPPPAAIGALEHLLAWKLSLHGVPVLGRVTVEVNPGDAFYTPFAPGAHVSLPRVAGHRDGDQTSCPGNAFYARLPSMRPQVASLAGSPARLEVSVPGGSAAVAPGAAVAVSGRLADLATGSPLAGEPIELQQITRGVEVTIATVTTGADGSWSATFTAAANTLVRALHRPAPAAVSDVVPIAVAPVLTLVVASPEAPVEVTGTVSPVLRHVMVDLYRVIAGRRHLMASKRVPAGSGQFAARFRPGRPGRYVVIARTVESARYVAGASPPVTVTIP